MLVRLTNINSMNNSMNGEIRMSENDIDTADKIVQAAIDLIHKKGFNETTMKDIAIAANVSEMTVFRHFSNKKGVFEAVIQKCSFIPSMQDIFNNRLTWDLETDLLLIGNTYQQVMAKNKTAILVLTREKTFLSAGDWEKLPPYHFKQFMTAYLKKMEAMEKIHGINIDAVVLSFIAMNFGFFYAKATLKNQFITVSTKEYIDTSVGLFVKGLTS